LTSSIPNGFSSEELQRLLAEARPEPCEDECSCCEPSDSKSVSAEHVFQVAEKYVTGATDELKEPAVHAVMVEMILELAYNWHMTVASKLREAGDTGPADAWLRDAGKFQAIMNIFDTVSWGDNDPRDCR